MSYLQIDESTGLVLTIVYKPVLPEEWYLENGFVKMEVPSHEVREGYLYELYFNKEQGLYWVELEDEDYTPSLENEDAEASLREEIELLKQENADIIFDNVLRDIEIEMIKNDIADLMFEIALGGN